MPTYRVEEASTGRAGCKNKECQDNKVKIEKGELRFGTWVEGESFQSWAWKHWGCVTPRQIASLKDGLGEDEDCSELDGFEELSSENQDKIREAVAQGHVPDDDWRGDVEVNRPGKTGFRVRGSKKKQDNVKADDDKKEAKPAKKRGKRAAAEAEDEGEEKAPASKKTKAAPKKKAAAEENGKHEGEVEPKGAKRGRKPGRPAKFAAPEAAKNADVGTANVETPKSSRARRAAGRAAKKDGE